MSRTDTAERRPGEGVEQAARPDVERDPHRRRRATACARCHTLSGRESCAPGGDLAMADLSVVGIVSFVRVMPVHFEVSAAAAYVHAAAARSSR